MLVYYIDEYAIKLLRKRRISDGKCLINGLLILKWKYWAPIINIPIRIDGIRTNEGYQIPTTSNVDKDIFVAPTIFRVKSLSPNCSNSFKTLWNLKVQTYATDIATVICDKLIKYSIFVYLVFPTHMAFRNSPRF